MHPGLSKVRTFLQSLLKRNHTSINVTTFIFPLRIAQLRPRTADTERRDGEGAGEPGEGLPVSQSLWFSHQLRWAVDPLPPFPEPRMGPLPPGNQHWLLHEREGQLWWNPQSVLWKKRSMENTLHVNWACKHVTTLPWICVSFPLEVGEPLEDLKNTRGQLRTVISGRGSIKEAHRGNRCSLTVGSMDGIFSALQSYINTLSARAEDLKRRFCHF